MPIGSVENIVALRAVVDELASSIFGIDLFLIRDRDGLSEAVIKWAVSLKSDWVCVADINRMISQEKRGGGTIAFRDQTLWRDLSKIDRSVP